MEKYTELIERLDKYIAELENSYIMKQYHEDGPALVEINAPLALTQVEVKAKLNAYYSVKRTIKWLVDQEQA